jgi:hypothetical protein
VKYLPVLLICVAHAVGATARGGDTRRDGPEIRIRQSNGELAVTVDGALFTRYVFAGAAKPYCWPLVGPTGDRVTRAFPMEKIDGEKQDHPHQRSLWFTHGSVNGIDFWGESDKSGRQVHRKFEAIKDGALGQPARIRAITDWVAPDGSKIAEDTRQLRLSADTIERVIDFDITVRASEGPLVFGDTKEGSFGIRVASSMDVDQPGDRRGGQIVNARGETNAQAWGRPAEWVDYSGPVTEKVLGITVMNHPSSFRFPTHWHVRTYGLFAANPFGMRDFYSDASRDGGHTLRKGEQLAFRYRIVLHQGAADRDAIAGAFERYRSE